jgi:hypothetical protein
MTAEFFALAFVSALKPKLRAIDLLLIENRQPSSGGPRSPGGRLRRS